MVQLLFLETIKSNDIRLKMFTKLWTHIVLIVLLLVSTMSTTIFFLSVLTTLLVLVRAATSMVG